MGIFEAINQPLHSPEGIRNFGGWIAEGVFLEVYEILETFV